MNRILLSSLAAVVLLGATCCNKQLGQGTVDLTDPNEQTQPQTPEATIKFSHPGAYVNADDLARVKQHVAAADANDPVYVAWTEFCKSPWAQETIKPSALETIVRGDPKNTGVSSENYILCDQQAASAFQLALRWQISGDTKYAEASRAILNEWARVAKTITANDNNQYLLAGFQGHAFANAAELLRDYEGWTASEQTSFKKWLKDLWYAKNFWFIDTHGGSGTCNLHYWSNWELANLASIMAIGIYLEDKGMIDYVDNQYYKGVGSGALKNIVPYDPVADPSGKTFAIAQSMESGRDQGHGTLVASMSAELCRMAQNVGLDFWEADNNRILAMFEYTAKYNVKVDGKFVATSMPFTEYKYCPPGCGCSNQTHGVTHTVVSADGRGTERPCWELIYAHYIKEAKLPANHAYYTKLFADQLRYRDGALKGDGGAGDSRYGSTSGAFDQLGWGTLLFYQGE